jgi:hypothetical protein
MKRCASMTFIKYGAVTVTILLQGVNEFLPALGQGRSVPKFSA